MTWLLVSAIVVLIFLGAAYWWATGGSGGPAPRWLTERVFAHRGLHDTPERPENSMAAFEAAIEAGHPIELDVHLTSDGEVIVFHDSNLNRMTGDPRDVEDVTLEERRELELARTPERIPTLSEVLAEVDGHVPVLVEIKNRDAVGPLEDILAGELAEYAGEVGVMSFNPYSLARMAEMAPEIPRGQLSGTFEGEDMPGYQVLILKNLMMNWKSEPQFVAYQIEALPSTASRVQKLHGRTLLAWTAKTPEEAVRARELADNLICDPGALPEPAEPQ